MKVTLSLFIVLCVGASGAYACPYDKASSEKSAAHAEACADPAKLEARVAVKAGHGRAPASLELARLAPTNLTEPAWHTDPHALTVASHTKAGPGRILGSERGVARAEDEAPALKKKSYY